MKLTEAPQRTNPEDFFAPAAGWCVAGVNGMETWS
jgi:hypothetical protein